MIRRIAKGVAVFWAVICVSPIFIILIGSLMGNAELYGLIGPILGEREGYAAWRIIPQYPTLRNIVDLLLDTPEYYVLFGNSIKLTLAIAIGQLLFAVPAAWGLARYRGRLGKILYAIYIFCMLLPFQVTMLSQYIVLNGMNMINTLWSLILPMVFSTFPVFIIYQSFEQLPDEVMEAAKIDGASGFRIFFSIGVPMSGEGILAAMLLGFLEYWNMVEQPVVFIRDAWISPLSIYLPEFARGSLGRSFAFSLFSMIPAIVAFAAGRNALENGFSVDGGSVND
ncbi:MAG: carbohydrate ABC transporter permease [Lachnospiraceae bacterium]|nr:carbohydrate ABC transporter permease [Lachnospiraceae bacterium]